ncbi:MAG: fused MFS/spermidine synthase [bacterium]|nr:fused MFS/spermidine synthase [bacterium]
MNRFDHRLAYALFVASGATGLVYEVTWFRNLSLIFGASFESSAIVLAAFMGGMSLGGFAFGRLARRFERPLRVYALLELGIGGLALVLPSLMRAIDTLYGALAPGDGSVDAGLLALRSVLAFAALVLPTFLMGATLPVVTRLLVEEDDEFGTRLAWLYGSNTVGAVLGTLAAGFRMIPALGVWRTQLAAIAVNVVIGLVALGLDRRVRPVEERTIAATAGPDSTSQDSIRGLRLVFWGTALSGFASLALEVLWTRALSVAVGSSTYSFSVMLAAFLTGIALGSLIHAMSPTAGRPLVPRFGWILAAAGVGALVVSSAIPQLPRLAIQLNLALYDDLARIRPLTTFLLAFVMMVVPCLFIGMAFPLANEARARLAAARGDGFARPVGDTLSLNTLGSIAGSLGAGFVLIPLVGLERAMFLAASLYVAWGAIVLAVEAAEQQGLTSPSVVFAVIAAGVALSLPALLPGRTDELFGAFSNNQLGQYVRADGGIDVEAELGKGVVRYYREGRSATVSVHEQDGFRSISVNGKIVASDDPEDLRTQYMLAHVPLLVHPDPSSALVIGMGAGTTLGGITAHDDLDRIALAEIEEAMLGAEPHFAASNGSPLSDPRLRVFLEDGRNYLKTTDHRYDVITADPIHPWTRGSGYLYTEEYYRLAAERLEAGGIMCQWLPVADLAPADFKSVVATFAKVFSYTMLWHSTSAVLIGSDAPLTLDLADLERRMKQPGVARQLDLLGLDTPLAFVGELRLDDAQVRDFAAGGLVNTDDNLHLEFSSPLAIGGDRQVWSVLRALHAYPPGVSPLRAAAPETVEALHAVQRAKTRTVLATIGIRSPDPGLRGEAFRALNALVAERPDYRPAAMALAAYLGQRAEHFLTQGGRGSAQGLVDAERAIALDPASGIAWHAQGLAERRRGRKASALAAFERARSLEPRQWRHHLEVARVLDALGRREEARAALAAGLEVHPTNEAMRSLEESWGAS